MLIVDGLILGFSLLQAMTPPWYVDSLIYHLQAALPLPRGRAHPAAARPVAGEWPLTIERLFIMGLMWGSDSFARLLHLTYATLPVLATYGFGQRYLRRLETWLTVALRGTACILAKSGL